MGGDTGGFLQLDGGMFSGQLQQALHHAQALWPTVLLHRFSPSACERSDQAATVQQVVGTPFDDVAFAAVQMSGKRHIIERDRKSTHLNSSHLGISYAVFCLKKKKIS